MTTKQLAQASGFSISYIQKIERADRVPKQAPTLDKLARALEVPLLHLMGATASGHTSASSSSGPPVADPTPLLLGPDWPRALKEAQRMLPHLAKQRKIQVQLETICQLQIHMGLYSQASDTVDQVEAEYAALQLEGFQDPLIEAMIDNKRGWIAIFKGEFGKSDVHFSSAAPIASKWGDKRLEGDSRHFPARAYIEERTFLLLYPDMEHAAKPDKGRLEKASSALKNDELLRAEDDLSKGYDLQWRSQALLFSGLVDEARKELKQALERLAGDPEVLAYQGMACSGGWLSPALDPKDAVTILDRSLSSAQGIGFPLGISTAITSFVYHAIVVNRARPSLDDLDGLILAFLLHPYIRHPVTRTAVLLARGVCRIMEEGTLQTARANVDYWTNIDHRVRHHTGQFDRLGFTVFSPSVVEERLIVIKRLLQRP